MADDADRKDSVTTAIPLNRLFRLAVLAGVERSVRLHIDRGDDVNARDVNGRTPLMLSAAANNATICQMLLEVGADTDLLNPEGVSALDIALTAGARDAASIISSFLAKVDGKDLDDLVRYSVATTGAPQLVAQEPTPTPFRSLVTFALPAKAASPAAAAAYFDGPILFADETAGEMDACLVFDLTAWEAESNQHPPEHDPTLSVAALAVQGAISLHRPIDASTDWEDVEVFLPDRATPLPRADDAEARERLRLVLLRAIREGSVPRSAIEDLTLDDDGEPNEEASALLSMVVNDLGAETDERFEYSTAHESFEVFVAAEEAPDEEDSVAEALAFVDDLADRRNDPLRIYQQEFQRETLLTAEGEVALGQAMERGIERALDVLAGWPFGIGVVLEAASKVTSGARPLRWLSSGQLAELQESALSPIGEPRTEPEPPAGIVGEDDECDPQLGIDPKASSEELSKLSAIAELLYGMAVSTNVGDLEWRSCRGVLASLGLTRGFLMELADSVSGGETESALEFAQAINAYRRARDRMTVANLKLVFSIAKKYLFSGQPLDDLLQEGNIGLIKAADRYDWRRGFKFSTYATWWIRQQVGRYIADKSKTIRLPVHIYEKTQRIVQSSRVFESHKLRAPSIDEIAAMVDLPARKVASLVRASLDPLPIHEIEALDDLIAVDAKHQFMARDPIDAIADKQLVRSVDRVLGTLKRKEENVLRMHFGIGIWDSMTLEEIGARLEVTRERIRQIEAGAIRRLKHPARLDQLLRELDCASSLASDQNEEASYAILDEPQGVDLPVLAPAAVGSPQPARLSTTATSINVEFYRDKRSKGEGFTC